MTAAAEEASYVDYDTFLDPDFSPTSFANDLVLSTNDPTDTPIDLATPLSRVLFDVQEVDIHIDNLTTKSAVELLEYTRSRSDTSSHILEQISLQLESLNEGYKRLEKDVIQRHAKAEQIHLAAERLCSTLRLGRVLARCFNLGRQLESQMEELGINSTTASATAPASPSSSSIRDNHRSMVSGSNTILEFRSITSNISATPGLERVTTFIALRNNLVTPLERSLTTLAQQTVREFSVSSTETSTRGNGTVTNPTFLQAEQARTRTASALLALYLLSPCPHPIREDLYEPRLMLQALTSYLQAILTSSLASLARALATLPTLDRTLAEVGGRCANVVALEQVLATTRRGIHPGLLSAGAAKDASNGHGADPDDVSESDDLDSETESDSSDDDADEKDDNPGITHQKPSRSAASAKRKPTTAQRRPQALTQSDEPLLPILLNSLDTSSLVSFFWRTLASNLSARVADIVNRGGVSARTLRSSRERVAGSVRECVLRSSRGAGGGDGTKGGVGAVVDDRVWEREAAVMVGSIVGALNR